MHNLPIIGAIGLLLILAVRSVAWSKARSRVWPVSPQSGTPRSSEPTSYAFRPVASL